MARKRRAIDTRFIVSESSLLRQLITAWYLDGFIEENVAQLLLKPYADMVLMPGHTFDDERLTPASFARGIAAMLPCGWHPAMKCKGGALFLSIKTRSQTDN
jgi:hypothetical protein